METAEINPLDKLKPQHKKFVFEYLNCLNGAEAYRRAGYAPKGAAANASRLLATDDVRAAVSSEGERMMMTTGEAIKHLSDIARTRLNDFFKIIRVLHTPTIRRPLGQLLSELNTEIDFEAAFATLANLSEHDLKKHEAEQQTRRLTAIRYRLELDRNPNAYRDVPGEPEWVEDVELDTVALTQAQSEGRIKSYQVTEFGPKIELYPADNALDKILQLHGRYKQLPGGTGDKDGKVIYRLPDGTELEF